MTQENEIKDRDGDGKPKADRRKGKFPFSVNRKAFTTGDAIVDGRKVLTQAKFTPASDHVLIQLTRPGSKSIGLDEDIDLAEPGKEEFWAFRSDRVFTFTVDERGYEWGRSSITEPELRDITGTPDAKALIFEHDEEPDEVLDEDAVIDLSARGTEHIRTGKRLITVFYKDEPFELERRVYTGSELATIFGVPEGYQLDLVLPNGKFDEIPADGRVKVRDGMHFVSHPPCGQSS